MKSFLEQTVITSKDLSEQPDSPYVLMLMGGDAFRGAFAADDLDLESAPGEGGIVYAYQGGKIIVAFNLRTPFIFIRRDQIETAGREAAIRESQATESAERALMRELYPERFRDRQEAGGTAVLPSYPFDTRGYA